MGSWTATTSLPQTTDYATSVVYNGYVYEIGGYNGYLYEIGGYSASAGIYFATVDYAPILSSGTIGTWTATTPLPVATGAATSVIYNGYMYEQVV